MTTMFPALKEAEDRLAAKQAELHDIFEQAGPDIDLSKVKTVDGDTTAKVDFIRKLNTELDDLGVKAEQLRDIAKAAERARRDPAKAGAEPGAEPGAPSTKGGQPKHVGRLFVESKAYRQLQGKNGPVATLDIELKDLFSTTNGWAPETTRTGRVIDYATRPLQMVDLIPQTTTGQTAVVYMEETTFTNNAAEIAEGGPYPESALELEEKSSPVKKVGTFLPVTDEQLEDEQNAETYLRNRLPFMVRQRMDGQILVGNGTGANLTGFLNVTGLQTQAKGTDPVPDAVYKALVKCRVTGQAIPNAAVFNPLDWQEVRLLRTADGIYIWGSPSEAGPARIWGVPAVEAQALTEGTSLVGDFQNFSELAVRRGMDVQVSNSHADYFVNGKQAVRADVRAALVIYRPSAFCTVTGI